MQPRPEAKQLALRLAAEEFLKSQADHAATTDDLYALNLQVWAEAFLRVTDSDARCLLEIIERRVRVDFVQRIVCAMPISAQALQLDEQFELMGRLFYDEAERENLISQPN